MTSNHLARYNPYFLGAKRFFDEIENLTHLGTTYPPFDLIEFSETNTYLINFALAGFDKDQLTVTQEKGYLTVECKKSTNEVFEEDEGSYLHQGISRKEFKRQFKLLGNVNVVSATFKNGLLSILLEKVVPESEKPKTFTIK